MDSLGQRPELDSPGQIHGANNRGWEWGYNTSDEVNTATHQHQAALKRAHAYDALRDITSYFDMTTAVFAHREPSRYRP